MCPGQLSHQEDPDDSGGDEGGADGFHGSDFFLQADGADDKRKDDAHIAGGSHKRRILCDGEGVEDDYVVGLGDETDGEDAQVAALPFIFDTLDGILLWKVPNGGEEQHEDEDEAKIFDFRDLLVFFKRLRVDEMIACDGEAGQAGEREPFDGVLLLSAAFP